MNIWTALLIFAIVMIVIERQRTVRSLRQDRREDDEAVDPIPSTRDSETDRELQELRERVKVLERITVDGREAKTIADEIEKLRDR